MSNKPRKPIHVDSATHDVDYPYLSNMVKNRPGVVLSKEVLEDIKNEMLLSYSKSLDRLVAHTDAMYSKYYGRPIISSFIRACENRGYYDSSEGITLSIQFGLEENDEEYNKRLDLDKENARKSKEAEEKKEKLNPEYAEYKRLLKKYGAKS